MATLTRALEDGADLPEITDDERWLVSGVTTEVAMFSLGQEIGRKFSQELSDARRTLEIVERATPGVELIEAAMKSVQALSDHLADWLMQGQHR
jgi:hypothetical protein